MKDKQVAKNQLLSFLILLPTSSFKLRIKVPTFYYYAIFSYVYLFVPKRVWISECFTRSFMGRTNLVRHQTL